MRSRRGASLVELLVVMSACAAILTTSAVLLHRALHAQTKSRAFLAGQRNALRLSDQLRQDVHRASAVLEKDLPPGVVLRLQIWNSQFAEYRYAAGLVERTVRAGDEVKSRETFEFPATSKLIVRQEANPRRVVLSLANDPTIDELPREGEPRPDLKTFAVPVHLHVEACLGRDAKYREPPGKEPPE